MSRKEETLTFKDIANKFDTPLKQAAQDFDLTLPAFKRRCRALNVRKWPFRKLMILLCKVPNESLEAQTAEIMEFLRASPENVNSFTDLSYSQCTPQNFKRLICGEKLNSKVPTQKRLLPNVQEAIPLPLEYQFMLIDSYENFCTSPNLQVVNKKPDFQIVNKKRERDFGWELPPLSKLRKFCFE